ncbi:DUF4114 domain-containing protein [Maritimibacter sp. UBA3975]|uniref:DUF4114 domain-containing protein n=1 Tax=Maritimibacter sp. UBA3975 TaxID=1946833 RepID=UPI000C0B8603|nr:DUF4114 domain-containing protein [Maritimibacter sp. UBA3975]MAM62774.1 hypothetical protein [Maritimibacter sp.]|tara:strand:- start:3458 stop:4642 length:1185 start_codon:yes stop_codon:yes gene_type:complete
MSTVELNEGYYTSNHADNDGGAFWIGDGSTLTATTNQLNVFENSADGDGGAGYYEAGAAVTLHDVLGIDNTASGRGDLAFGADGTITDPDTQMLILDDSSCASQSVHAGPGNDEIEVDGSDTTFTTGGGRDVISGSITDALGDTFTDFGVSDLFILTSLGPAPAVTFDNSSPIQSQITFGGETGNITLQGNYIDKFFFAVSGITDLAEPVTVIGLADPFPILAEKVAVADTDPEEQGGVSMFLAYNNNFLISVRTEGAFTSTDNAVGYYVRTGENISDVTIFSTNAKNGGNDNVIGVDGILTPFIIEDGFVFADGLSGSETLTIDEDGNLLVNGEDSGQTLYHALDSLNPDDENRVQFGMSDSDNLRVGFEDGLNLGDRDFQDVIVDISLLAPI